MDWEVPADAWYVWLAVSLISVALAGLALGVSTGPPPDAEEAANAIEGVTASEYTASSTYETDAETITIDRQTIEMENEHGTSHAGFSYGIVVPVNGHEELENVVYGSSIETQYEGALRDGDSHAFDEFKSDVEDAFDENSGTEFSSSGELRTRAVVVDSEIDQLDPLEERVEIEAKPSPSATWPDGIRTVELSYDGIEGTEIAFGVEGVYVGLEDGTFNENESKRFADGTGDLELEIRSGNLGRTGSEPVSYEFELLERERVVSGQIDGESDGQTWENEIEREIEFDHDHPAIDRNEDTGTYHVTLVVI